MRSLVFIGVAFVAGVFGGKWIIQPMIESPRVAPPAAERASETTVVPNRETVPPVAAVSAPPPTDHPTIHDALKGDDPLACAARVMAWLETTDAETFRQLAEDPKKFPTPHFSGFGRQFQDAFCAALAERWLVVDPNGAMAAMQRVDAGAHFSWGPGGLLYSLASLRPELVLEKATTLSRGNFLESHTSEALTALAARDLKAAQRFAEKWQEPPLDQWARKAIIDGVATTDPLRALALAGDSKDQFNFATIVNAAAKLGPLVFQQVVQAAGDRLGPYAISPEFILRHPELANLLPNLPAPPSGFLNPGALASAERLPPAERERLLANYDSLPPGPRAGAAAALACVWARTEPRAAADWALAHAKADDGANAENAASQQVFLRWITSDPDAALAWWRAIPASPLRAALGTNASTYLAEEGRLDEAREIFQPAADATNNPQATAPGVMSMGGGSGDEQATVHLGQLLAARDPAAAGAWFATLPPTVATYQTTLAFLPKWYARAPEAVARWLETLPAGMARDVATRTFVKEAARISPAGAGEWVATVADPDLRQSAASLVYWEMRRDDPAGAKRWLGELRGVDEAWREGALRR